MTDILLINPSSITVQNNPIPFGVAYLAGFLEKGGYSVKILDLSAEKYSQKEILNYIDKIKPKKIGISCMSVHANFVKELSKKIKEKYNIPIIVGGIHPTALPQKSLDYWPDVDILVRGEGEITLSEIMAGKPLEKIDGIAYRKKENIKLNKEREFISDLDVLPFPARHLLPDLKKYSLGFDWEGRKPAAMIFSSRGCPFSCIYCASKIMWKQRLRLRSARNVLNEIDFLVKKYGTKEILFYDDHFVFNKKRLREICMGLIKRNYDLTWGCMSRVDCFDLETALLMKKSGCHMISFGVESGSQTVLDHMEKRVQVDSIIKAFDICKKAGICTKASFIFGAPGETRDTIKDTQNVIRRINPDYIWLFIMTPMPGTKLYKLHEESGIASEEWSMYDQTTYNRFYGTNLGYAELRDTVKKTYKNYYLSFHYIFSQLKKLNMRKINVYISLFKKIPLAIKYVSKGREKNEQGK